jgi:hypothetical protein
VQLLHTPRRLFQDIQQPVEASIPPSKKWFPLIAQESAEKRAALQLHFFVAKAANLLLRFCFFLQAGKKNRCA